MSDESKFTVTDFGGTASVLGYKRKFSYREGDGRLSVFGLDESEAKLVLSILWIGRGVLDAPAPEMQAEEVPDRATAHANWTAEEKAKKAAATTIAKAAVDMMREQEQVVNVHNVAMQTVLAADVARAVEAEVAALPVVEEKEAPKPERKPRAKKVVEEKTPVVTITDGELQAVAIAAEEAKPVTLPSMPVELSMPSIPPPVDKVVLPPPQLTLVPTPDKAALDAAWAAEAAKKKPVEPAGDYLAPAVEAVETKPVAADGKSYDLEILKSSHTLRDILEHLFAHGYTEESEFISVCTQLKAEVPVLSRVSSLPDRIKRALAVMGKDD